MTTLTTNDIRSSLRDKVCTVVFTKKDGTTRTMKCTLLSSYLEQHNLIPSGGGPVTPEYQIRCVDIDINQWRSFNLDSVLSFE